MPVTYGWYSQRVLLFLLLEIIIDSSVHLVFLHVKLSFNLLWVHAVIISIFRWSNWNTERLCSLPKVKQLLSEQARTWTVCLIPKPRIWSYKMWTWISVRHCSPSAFFSVCGNGDNLYLTEFKDMIYWVCEGSWKPEVARAQWQLLCKCSAYVQFCVVFLMYFFHTCHTVYMYWIQVHFIERDCQQLWPVIYFWININTIFEGF